MALGVHSAAYGMSAVVLTREGRDVEGSPPATSDVTNAWHYTSAPPVCLHSDLYLYLNLSFLFYLPLYPPPFPFSEIHVHKPHILD
jgi:hypothetical protein